MLGGVQVMIMACLLKHSTADYCLSAEVKKIQSWRAKYTPEYTRLCRELDIAEDGRVMPKEWGIDPGFQWLLTRDRMNEMRMTEEAVASENTAREVEADMEAEHGLQALRLFSLDSDLAHVLVKARENDEIELPFELAPDQQMFVTRSGSKMAIGRSGTGKTTAIFKMLYAATSANISVCH
jgi:hypothetical protein